MPIKPEDILSALDIDTAKYDDVKSFTEDFSAGWIRREEAAKDDEVKRKVFGAVNGSLRVKAKRALKANGIEDVKVEDVDPGDIFELFADRVPKMYGERITELESKAKGNNTDKALKEWEGKYAEAQKKYAELESLHGAQVKKYTDLESMVKAREVEAKVNAEWEKALGSVKWKSGIDDLTRDGFVSRVKKDYQIRFDDTGAAYAADANGNRIPDEKKAQKFLDLTAIVNAKAKEFKLDETSANPHAGKPIAPVRFTPQQPAPMPNGNARQPIRQIHPGRRAAV